MNTASMCWGRLLYCNIPLRVVSGCLSSLEKRFKNYLKFIIKKLTSLPSLYGKECSCHINDFFFTFKIQNWWNYSLWVCGTVAPRIAIAFHKSRLTGIQVVGELFSSFKEVPPPLSSGLK